MGLPILGFLPAGDAAEIVNHNGFGIATKWGDIESARDAVEKIINSTNLDAFASRISENKEVWSMKHNVSKLNDMLRELSHAN